MKLIIAGSRDIKEAGHIIDAMVLGEDILSFPEEVVNGGCWGVDKAGVIWAKGVGALVKSFFPDWTRYGKSAGPIRNNQMAEHGDALLAIWDGESKGTFNMIEKADKHGLEMLIVTVGKIKEI